MCEGKYEGREIVVDHLVFDLKEFEGINLNDRVCVTVKLSRQIADRDDAEGIRSFSEDVKIFISQLRKSKKSSRDGHGAIIRTRRS